MIKVREAAMILGNRKGPHRWVAVEGVMNAIHIGREMVGLRGLYYKLFGGKSQYKGWVR